MRRVLLIVVAVILVNLPWANDAWVQHQLDGSGVPTTAFVVRHARTHGQNFVSYRFSPSVDPRQHLYDAVVTDRAYRIASTTGRLRATVLRGSPGSNRVDGEVTGSGVIVIAVIGDAIILLLLAFAIRRSRRWSRLRVTRVEGDLVTVMLGGLTLTATLADDPDTAALHPTVGDALRARLFLVASEDVVEGPPLGGVTHLGGAEYRIAGRVHAMTPVRTELVLDNGYVLSVVGDDVEHVAEVRGPAVVVGTLVLSAVASAQQRRE